MTRGNWIIAQKEIDLKIWRDNRKNSDFLTQENEYIGG